jgi:hypothetical protein
MSREMSLDMEPHDRHLPTPRRSTALAGKRSINNIGDNYVYKGCPDRVVINNVLIEHSLCVHSAKTNRNYRLFVVVGVCAGVDIAPFILCYLGFCGEIGNEQH